MGFIAPLAAVFGIEIESLVDRFKRDALVNGLIAFCALIAIIFLLIAGYVALAAAMGPLIAALVMAGGALVLTLLIFLISKIGARARKRRELERRRKNEAGAVVTTAAITALPTLIRSPLGKRLGIPLVVLAAYLLFRRPGASDEDEA
jgi:membrane protein DedA with SNARE-associated domain